MNWPMPRAAAILPMFRADVSIENKAAKGSFDPVTAADRAGEQALRELISGRYPDHSIRGEEFPPHEGTGPFTWVLDPIDGTKAFIGGLPVWATLIGLLKDGVPFIGLMDQPFVKERFIGTPEDAHGEGPFGRTALRVRDVGSLDQALLGTSHPANCGTGAKRQRFDQLETRVKPQAAMAAMPISTVFWRQATWTSSSIPAWTITTSSR